MHLLSYNPVYKRLYSIFYIQVYIRIFAQAIIPMKIMKLRSNVTLKFFSKVVDFTQLELFNIVVIDKKH